MNSEPAKVRGEFTERIAHELAFGDTDGDGFPELSAGVEAVGEVPDAALALALKPLLPHGDETPMP